MSSSQGILPSTAIAEPSVAPNSFLGHVAFGCLVKRLKQISPTNRKTYTNIYDCLVSVDLSGQSLTLAHEIFVAVAVIGSWVMENTCMNLTMHAEEIQSRDCNFQGRASSPTKFPYRPWITQEYDQERIQCIQKLETNHFVPVETHGSLASLDIAGSFAAHGMQLGACRFART